MKKRISPTGLVTLCIVGVYNLNFIPNMLCASTYMGKYFFSRYKINKSMQDICSLDSLDKQGEKLKECYENGRRELKGHAKNISKSLKRAVIYGWFED